MLQFRFELWNEPDLHTYNILNYTLAGNELSLHMEQNKTSLLNFSFLKSEYLEYAHGVSHGLESSARQMHFRKPPLRGPAGLFKSFGKHQLCFGLLEYCASNISMCPIDIITFHRKGDGSSIEILRKTIELVDLFNDKYPNLKLMPYANTEADPSSNWAKNVTSYADVTYAHMIVSIVLQHWTAFIEGSLENLESISHDNSFLSYHPFEFEQRTILARFAMNNSHPKTVHFIEKPAYAALGMLSSLAIAASEIKIKDDITYIISMGNMYSAVLLLSESSAIQVIKINLDIASSNNSFAYFAEFLDQQMTNPYSVWKYYNEPAYPNETVFAEMMHSQVSIYLIYDMKWSRNVPSFIYMNSFMVIFERDHMFCSIQQCSVMKNTSNL